MQSRRCRRGWARCGHGGLGVGLIVILLVMLLCTVGLAGLVYLAVSHYRGGRSPMWRATVSLVLSFVIVFGGAYLVLARSSLMFHARLFVASPLHWAVFGGHGRCAGIVLGFGADANGAASFRDGRMLPLHLAAATLHREDLINRLIDGGADVNGFDPTRRTALDWAARSGNVEAATILIARGAALDKSGPLAYAATGSPSMVRFLLAQGAPFPDPGVDSYVAQPLWTALSKHRGDIALILVEGGSPVDFANRDGVTPLHLAASAGLTEVVAALLKRTARPNATDVKGRTPLDVATDAVRPLLTAQGGSPGVE